MRSKAEAIKVNELNKIKPNIAMTIGGIGYLAGIAAFFSASAYCIVQILQILGVLRFPWDEILIYGTSLLIVIPFILQMLSLHYVTPNDKKFWTHAALIFSIIYSIFVTANYVVQLATVIPAKLDGNSESVRLLEQTPHSLFWNFDAIGYIAMGLATLFAIPALKKTGFEKVVRFSLLAHSLVTPLIAIVYFYPIFSQRLLLLGFPWAFTAPLFMLLLQLCLEINSKRRNSKSKTCCDQAGKRRGSTLGTGRTPI